MYDLIIIGAGPAGLTAGIYATRYKLKNLVIGKLVGGTITLAHNICNYPGLESISGLKWAELVSTQLKNQGGELIISGVDKVTQEQTFFKILAGKKEYLSKTIIIATGSQRRELGVPGEKEYLGRGVSYCTTCDIPFFKEKTIAIIGGADAAVTGAIHAANFAKKVYIIYRKEKLRAEPVWVEEALHNPKIEVIYNTNVTKIFGKEITNHDQYVSCSSDASPEADKVYAVELDTPYKDKKILSVDGLFVEIGGIPTTALAASLGIDLDEEGFMIVNEDKQTNIYGVFAAGDITNTGKKFQQVITACSQGAKAAAAVFKFLKGEKAPQIKGS